MKIGFTGTRKGMSTPQKNEIRSLLKALHEEGAEFHHGDCTGADAEAHELAREAGYVIVIHPPTEPLNRAFMKGDKTREPRSYLIRNKHIVEESDILLAAPEGLEKLRSGTWSTVRHARRLVKRVITVNRYGESK